MSRCSLCVSRYGSYLCSTNNTYISGGVMITKPHKFYSLCRRCENMVKKFLIDLEGRSWYNVDIKNWIDQVFNYGNTAHEIINWCIENDKWIPKGQTAIELGVFNNAK